jgi:serine phosphatase RsbU (regulator of sigma subunit)
MAYAGKTESALPPAGDSSEWSRISGQVNLKERGWYWFHFKAGTSVDQSVAVFAVNPALKVQMFENIGGKIQDLKDSRMFKSGAWWGDFRLVLNKNVEREFFIKVFSPRSGYNFGFDLALNTPDEILQKRTQGYIPWLLFVGLIACLILYNSYLFVQTRDSFYLFYVLSEFCLHFLLTPGLVFFWNWIFPSSVDYFLWNGVGMLLGYPCLIFYLYYFGRFDEFFRRRGRLLYFLGAFAFLPFAISILLSHPIGQLLPGHMISFMTMLIALVYVAISSRTRNATILALSFAPIPVAGSIFVVARLTGTSNDNLGFYSLAIALALEGLLMAIALADRIKQLELKSREEESMRRKLEFELETAEVFQRILLPSPLEHRGYVTQPYYRPAARNGGDWFTSYVDEKSDTLYLVVIDVTGHGLTSAMLAGVLSGVVMSQLEDKSEAMNPREKLQRVVGMVNSTLYQMSQKSGMLATGLFAVINRKANELLFINCAHPPMLIEAGNGFEFLPSSGRRLGSSEFPEVTCECRELGSHGRLFAYTDGLVENTGPDGKGVSQRKLKSILQDSRPRNPVLASQFIQETFESIWRGSSERDDATYILVDWTPAPN